MIFHDFFHEFFHLFYDWLFIYNSLKIHSVKFLSIMIHYKQWLSITLHKIPCFPRPGKLKNKIPWLSGFSRTRTNPVLYCCLFVCLLVCLFMCVCFLVLQYNDVHSTNYITSKYTQRLFPNKCPNFYPLPRQHIVSLY